MPFGILRDHFLLTLSYIVVHFSQIDLLLVHLTLDILMDDVFLFALSCILVAICFALSFCWPSSLVDRAGVKSSFSFALMRRLRVLSCP